VPTVAHDLDHERALVARCRAGQRVDRVGDAVHRGVGTDRHVGAHHVVVDRPNEADEREVLVALDLGAIDVTAPRELVEQRRPLAPEEIGPREAAVTADDHEAVDPVLDEVPGGQQAALAGPELRAPRRPDDRAAALDDAADVFPPQGADAIAAGDEALVAVEHGKHRRLATAPTGPRPARPRSCRRVAPAGDDAKGRSLADWRTLMPVRGSRLRVTRAGRAAASALNTH
jgi:hypothetical protein